MADSILTPFYGFPKVFGEITVHPPFESGSRVGYCAVAVNDMWIPGTYPTPMDALKAGRAWLDTGNVPADLRDPECVEYPPLP